MIIANLLFWISISLLAYHYVIYPALLYAIHSRKSNVKAELDSAPNYPFSIIIPAHNEEACIADKLDSILANNIDQNQYEVLIGSDNSSDRTNEIVQSYVDKYPHMQLFIYTERQGKINLVENLVTHAKHEILIHTDANVLFKADCIARLVNAFSDTKIGVVGANIVNTEVASDGISVPESSYISFENRIKFWEGELLGSMMGAFGGCFAMRKNLMVSIPNNFIVDDFYLTFKVMEQGYKSVYDLEAICFEDVSNDWKEEFRRKLRIGIGNYQNLLHFKSWLFKPFSAIGFSFISHKALRWIGWLFIVFMFICANLLATSSGFFALVSLCLWISLAAVLLDFLLSKMNVHIGLLRYNFHFYMMNLALCLAFFKFLAGVKSNIWTPTKRHQLNK